MFASTTITTCSRKSAAQSEFSRILSAAVINSGFRSMLLSDPAKAVSGGYSGERFNLSRKDKNRLSSIHASSLAEFAAQLADM
jgi:hypothetical protein